MKPIQQMRVLQIGMRWSGSAGSGGLDRVFSQLVEGLPRFGMDVQGLVEGPADVSSVTRGRVQAFADRPMELLPRLMSARRSIRSTLQDGSIDLVASHFALYAAPALDMLANRPFVAHFHGPWAAESAQEGGNSLVLTAKKALEGHVYRRAARVIVLSRAFADLVVRDYGVDPGKVRIVPGGVDLSRFPDDLERRTARLRLGWPVDRPILISVRRLAPRMGLSYLLEAMARVVKAIPEVLLVVAGTGASKQELVAQAESIGISQNVMFTGFLADEDLPFAFAAADLSVVPSTALEGFGLVALESLAAGTPAVVTRVGGLPEVVEALTPELICPSADAKALASLLVNALLGNMSLPNATMCRDHAMKCSMTVALRNTAAIYNDVV